MDDSHAIDYFHDNSYIFLLFEVITVYKEIRYYYKLSVSQPPNVYIYVLNLEPFYARTVLCQVRQLYRCL